MVVKHLRHNRQLEDALRRHGIEGEDAFYLLALCYVRKHGRCFDNPPERIIERGERGFVKIKHDEYLLFLLDSTATIDPCGEYLPSSYQYFLGRRFREGSGKFFTPHTIASAITKTLPIKKDAVIMDPTCGGGTFLMEASRRWGKVPCSLIGNDVDASLVDLAQVVLDLATPAHHQKSFLNSNIYEPSPEFRQWYEKVDYILANPPFSLPIRKVDIESPLFRLGYRNSDALFLDICFNLLKEGGRLACLLPHSIIANNEFQQLRAAVEDSWDLLAVLGMPEGVFHLTASTTTRADIVVLRKLGKEFKRSQETIFAFAPSVGIPLSTRTYHHEENDLEKIVNDPAVAEALGTDKVA